MYSIHSFVIVSVLLVSMIGTVELGYRYGRRRREPMSERELAQTNAVQGAILGLLALMLGFTLSLALQRYNDRSVAVVGEANAIGTAWLRAQLLPVGPRAKSDTLLRRYLDLRVQASRTTLADEEHRRPLLDEAGRVQLDLWRLAQDAAAAEPNPVTTGLYIQALNDMIDALGSRDSELARHVPEPVLWLLYLTFLMSGLIVGYACGVASHRPPGVTHLMLVMICMLVLVIIDLDRPRRGMIEVSQKSLTDLQATMLQWPPAEGTPTKP